MYGRRASRCSRRRTSKRFREGAWSRITRLFTESESSGGGRYEKTGEEDAELMLHRMGLFQLLCQAGGTDESADGSVQEDVRSESARSTVPQVCDDVEADHRSGLNSAHSKSRGSWLG